MKKQKTGKKSLADQKVMVCLSKYDCEELEKLLEISDFKTMSGLIRHIIDGEPIKVVHSYTSQGEGLAAIAAIRKELHLLVEEINKVTNLFRFQESPEAILADILTASFICLQVGEALEPLTELIEKVAEQWVPSKN